MIETNIGHYSPAFLGFLDLDQDYCTLLCSGFYYDTHISMASQAAKLRIGLRFDWDHFLGHYYYQLWTIGVAIWASYRGWGI